MTNTTNANDKAVAKRDQQTAVSVANAVERLVIMGDLSQLSPADRVIYYKQMCAAVGVDWIARPFDYLVLDGRLTLYANQNCAAQLRDARNVSVKILSREDVAIAGVYIVTALASLPDGRCEEATGAVAIEEEGGEWKTSQTGKRYFQGNGQYTRLRGKEMANAMMRAETKAKRRATFALCGLGAMADEPEGQPVDVDIHSGNIREADPRDETPLNVPRAASPRFHTQPRDVMLPSGRVFIPAEDMAAPEDPEPAEPVEEADSAGLGTAMPEEIAGVLAGAVRQAITGDGLAMTPQAWAAALRGASNRLKLFESYGEADRRTALLAVLHLAQTGEMATEATVSRQIDRRWLVWLQECDTASIEALGVAADWWLARWGKV